MPIDILDLMAGHRDEKFELFDRHLNSQLVRVLKTIGYNVDYVRGRGPHLFDADGNRYLDLLSGFGVFAVGRNHPTVVAAIDKVLHADLAGLVQLDVSLLAGLLAERLSRRMPWLEKTFFCNSGAETVEAAIKFSRAATRRSKIVYCEHAFHGLTYGALSLNGDEVYRGGFEPLVGECISVPFNDLPALERVLAGNDVAAFVIEPIQGKGVNIPADTYLREAHRLCRKHRTLLVADEVQTGMGRTGRFLACNHWGVEPDIVLLAKALSGGFVPIGAVVMRKWIFDKVFDRMDRAFVHGSTFAKNDLAMAAGIATLDVMEEEGLVERAASLGDRLIHDLRQRLRAFDIVKDVRGKGLMVALEFGPPRSLKLKAAYALTEQANKGLFCQLILIPLFKEHRILAQVAGHNMSVIKLLPPLVVDDDDIAWTVNGFAKVIGDSHSMGGFWELGRTLAAQALQARGGAA